MKVRGDTMQMENISITENLKQKLDIMLNEYHTIQKKFVVDEQTIMHELITKKVTDADTLLVWYFIQQEQLEKLIVKLKDVFLNCQDDINKFVFQNGNLHITYKELLEAITNNLLGVKETDIAPYLREN